MAAVEFTIVNYQTRVTVFNLGYLFRLLWENIIIVRNLLVRLLVQSLWPRSKPLYVKLKILAYTNPPAKRKRLTIGQKIGKNEGISKAHTIKCKGMLQKQMVFLENSVLKICSKFAGESPCRNVISIKLFYNGCSPVNLLHILRTPFCNNTSGGLLLTFKMTWLVLEKKCKWYIGYVTENRLFWF